MGYSPLAYDLGSLNEKPPPLLRAARLVTSPITEYRWSKRI